MIYLEIKYADTLSFTGFFPPEDCFGNPGSSVLTDEFQDSILNVKNSIGVLIQIVLVR